MTAAIGLGWAAFALALTAATIAGGRRWGRGLPLDIANHRSLHAGAIPRIGGMAMGPAIAAALFGLATTMPLPAPLWSLLAGAAGLWLLSLADDWRSLPVLPRLLGQAAAAALAARALELPPAAGALAVPGMIWLTNLYNFMDGADGLAGTMTAIGFAGYGLAAAAGGPEIAAVSWIVAAAAIGFLPFNLPPARVFMGDAGSVPLGFLAGALGLAGWRQGLWPLWFPPLLFLPFIADATVTLLRRLARGERVWQAHRDHAYQRLVRLGWSRRRLLATAAALMAAGAAGGLLLLRMPAWLQAAGVGTWLSLQLWLLRRVDRRWRSHGELAEFSEKPGNPEVL